MQKSATIWVLAGLLLAALLVGVIELAKGGNVDGLVLADAMTIGPADWVEGNRDAKTILVEYSDFQCPACGVYFAPVKQLVQEFGKDIAFVYRHFPLPQHKNAKAAALAAEAAGRQGKFWEMHGLLFDNQGLWSEDPDAAGMFEKYAVRLGLDMAKYALDIGSPELKIKINSDFESGLKLGINGTPTFYLNGRKLDNPRNYDEFKTIIQSAIASGV